jgi:hypothetical protein
MPFHLLEANAPPAESILGDVGHRRTVARSISRRALAVGWGGDPQAAWRTWLRALGRERTRAACAQVHALNVYCRRDDGLRRRIEPEQRAIERHFAAMVAELRGLRILTRDEAQRAQPVICVELIDERGHQSRRLPDPRTLLVPRRLRRPAH